MLAESLIGRGYPGGMTDALTRPFFVRAPGSGELRFSTAVTVGYHAPGRGSSVSILRDALL